MSQEEKDAFKLGFLTRCAEEGLRGEKLTARIKAAEGGTTVGGALAAGLGLPIAAGLLAGGAGGYGLAKMTQPQLNDDDIKADEIANTYRVLAQRAKARRKIRQYRA